MSIYPSIYKYTFFIASAQRPLDGNSYNLPFAFQQDGTLRLIDIKSSDCKIIEKCSIGVPITSFSFSPTYRHIALGSSRVSIIFMNMSLYCCKIYSKSYIVTLKEVITNSEDPVQMPHSNQGLYCLHYIFDFSKHNF